MNRFWAITLTLCFVLSLAACAKPGPQNPTTPTTNPTTTPTTTSTQAKPSSYQTSERLDKTNKEGVPAFFKLLSEQMPDEVNGKYPIKEEDCCNITPPGVDAQTNLQIFLFDTTRTAFIVQDGTITAAVSGTTSLVLCDPDKDGKTDVLITGLWGSGNTVSHVYVYSSATKQATQIFRDSDYSSYPFKVLWAADSGADVNFEGKTEADNNMICPIVCLEAVYKSGKLIEYVVTGIVGNVAYKDGTFQFVPYT